MGLPPLYLERVPMGRPGAGRKTRVRVYSPPPGDPRCELVLQGAMPADLADLLARLLRLGARALGLPLTEAGRTPPTAR